MQGYSDREQNKASCWGEDLHPTHLFVEKKNT